jgi:lipoprotein-anchoring transpeptidase ErfK/SrfK
MSRRLVWALLPGLLNVAPALAQPQTPMLPATPAMAHLPLAAPAVPAPVPEAAPAPLLSPAAVETEAGRLHAEMVREVPGLHNLSPAQQQALVLRVWDAFRTANQVIDRPQLVVAVDRNPRVQEASVILARPVGPWEVIGTTHVSTGQAGRFDHYITPTGVFLHTDAILDYRAEGTYNENHIRGYGVKGMRIWDFGWQDAAKGWRSDHGKMRLEMHATDPAVLEARIGRPASQGCIRIPAAMNRFLDKYGVLDADYERVAKDDIRYRALLLPNRTPTPLAGHALVVIDSSEKLPTA